MKYYVSGARNKLISSLYFRTSSTSTTNAYFTYIGYDADGDVIAAGKVTLGDESVDMEYSASFGGSVTFLESDFSKAFSGKAGEKLDYVTFAMNRATVVMNNKTYSLNDGSNAAIFGWAYTTSKATTKLSSTDKCYYQASYTQLDLDEVTYVTGSYRTKYTVYLPYTAVGTSGSRYEGYTAITVSGDDSITASGASMKTLGAADAVLRAYPNAAYVMFKQPAVSEGRLLYNFRSVAAQNYTAVDYSKDQFYLSGTSAKNLYLDSVFFLPAADCSTQIRLAFTVYGTSGTQLGSGELTVRVASKTASSVFSDVNARTCSWAANAVDFMNEYGLVKGTGTSTFGWKGNMTRGDFVLILYRNAGSPSVYGVSNPFTDVKSTDYYYEAVLWAYRNNVVNGTSTTTFGPKGKITREQIASILWRLAGKPVYSASLRSYTDYASVSDYAYDAMSWAVGSGYVKGSGAKPGVFTQQQARRAGRVIDAIWNQYPRFTELEVRSHLARFGYRGEEVFKDCASLSGGELARLRFAELALERPNLMFLDEPTNHLDIYMRESLTQALAAYTGTLLLVTHDRYLMQTLGCPIMYLEDGKATFYPSFAALQNRDAGKTQEQQKTEDTAKKQAYGKEQRKRRAEVRARLKKVESEIEELGAHIVELENEINDPEVLRDHLLLRDKCDELDDTRFHQQELYDEWEKLAEEQETFENEGE